MAKRTTTKSTQTIHAVDVKRGLRQWSDRPSDQNLSDSSGASASQIIATQPALLKVGKGKATGAVAVCALTIIALAAIVVKYMY